MSGITGNFSHFDPSEYYQTVELQIAVSEAKNLCDQPSEKIKNQIAEIKKRLAVLELYSSGRPYNTPTVTQVSAMKESANNLLLMLNKGAISQDYCLKKTTNLEILSDFLRTSVGDKKQ
jgi:hypothetical protein